MAKQTGPYPEGRIDRVRPEQVAAMKEFKGSKHVSTQWLTKEREAKTQIDKPFKGKGAK